MDYSYIPEGFCSITPYLILDNAASAIIFYQKAFNAIPQKRLEMPDGKIGHATIKIGNSIIMLADEFPDMGHKSPKTLGGSPVNMHLYVKNSDDAFTQAIAAGAKQFKPMETMFFGERMGSVEDPFGYIWTLSTKVENLSDDEIKLRLKQMYSNNAYSNNETTSS